MGLLRLRCYLLILWQSTDEMDAPTHGLPVKTFEDNHYSMRLSNDVDHSDPVGLSSLGVVELDLAIVPDVFGLRAFDSAKPITRMLPGQFPNELRVLIPDLGIAPEGFHDISDLSATPAWRTSRLSPGDVTSLRRRWPRILFHAMHKRQEEMETLRRECRDRPEREFRQGHPDHSPQCHEYVTPALDQHMMNNHLELGQLWRCSVEWCTVWKGSLSDCLAHLTEKHGGSQFVALRTSAGRIRCGGGCPTVSRIQTQVGTHASHIP